jgi:hypothetical protein
MPTRQASKSGNSARKSDNVWTDEERAAMQEIARERYRSATSATGSVVGVGLVASERYPLF